MNRARGRPYRILNLELKFGSFVVDLSTSLSQAAQFHVHLLPTTHQVILEQNFPSCIYPASISSNPVGYCTAADAENGALPHVPTVCSLSTPFHQ
jgi:hypothetical protein